MLYLRFGTWHPSETSRNYATGRTEDGVSTFGVRKRNGKWDIVIDHYEDAVRNTRDIGEYGDLTDTFWAFVRRMESDRREAEDYGYAYDPDNIFILRGEVVGYGWDGEPLIQDIEIVERVSPSDLVATDLNWRWDRRRGR